MMRCQHLISAKIIKRWQYSSFFFKNINFNKYKEIALPLLCRIKIKPLSLHSFIYVNCDSACL